MEFSAEQTGRNHLEQGFWIRMVCVLESGAQGRGRSDGSLASSSNADLVNGYNHEHCILQKV